MKTLISLLSIAFTLNSAFAVGFVQSDWESYTPECYSFKDGNVIPSESGGNALNYVGTPLKMSDGAKLTFGMSFDNDKLLAIANDYENNFCLNPIEADIAMGDRVDFAFNSNGIINAYLSGNTSFDEYLSGFEAGKTSQITIEYVVEAFF